MDFIVKYDNILNELKLGNFKSVELDFLMALCYQFKDKGTSKLEFSFAELRNLTAFSKLSNREIYDILDGIGEKIVGMKIEVKTEKGKKKFVLFIDYEIADDCSTYALGIHPDFAYVLNDLAENFTTLDLKTFVSLKSKYSKNLYRLLKQFDSEESGWRLFKIDDLREKLGCPKSYPNKKFIAEILNPSISEIKESFLDLKVEYTRGRTKGNPITHVEFRWRVCANDDIPGQMSLDDFKDFGLTQEEKVKAVGIANAVVKSKDKPKKKSSMHYTSERKNDYEAIEEAWLNKAKKKNDTK